MDNLTGKALSRRSLLHLSGLALAGSALAARGGALGLAGGRADQTGRGQAGRGQAGGWGDAGRDGRCGAWAASAARQGRYAADAGLGRLQGRRPGNLARRLGAGGRRQGRARPGAGQQPDREADGHLLRQDRRLRRHASRRAEPAGDGAIPGPARRADRDRQAGQGGLGAGDLGRRRARGQDLPDRLRPERPDPLRAQGHPRRQGG